MPEIFPISQTLVEYTEVTLPIFAVPTSHQAVLLRGETDIDSLIAAINTLHPRVRALAYKPQDRDEAVLLIDRYNPAEWVHPSSVVRMPAWTEEEMRSLEHVRAKDTNVPLVLDIHAIWQRALESQDPIHTFLTEVYGHNGRERNVTVVGTCPMLPAILAILWFVEQQSTVTV